MARKLIWTIVILLLSFLGVVLLYQAHIEAVAFGDCNSPANFSHCGIHSSISQGYINAEYTYITLGVICLAVALVIFFFTTE